MSKKQASAKGGILYRSAMLAERVRAVCACMGLDATEKPLKPGCVMLKVGHLLKVVLAFCVLPLPHGDGKENADGLLAVR